MAYTKECDLHAVMVAVRCEGGNTRTDGAHREQHFPTLLGCPVETSRTVYGVKRKGCVHPFHPYSPTQCQVRFRSGEGGHTRAGEGGKGGYTARGGGGGGAATRR